MNARVWQLTYAVPFEHGTEVDLNDWGTEQLTSLAPQPAFRNVFHRRKIVEYSTNGKVMKASSE